jgi:alkylation response protein AidB-like acyl-CoA dehydrogenase
VLDGEKAVVLHGDSADAILVTARVAGGRATAAASGSSSSMPAIPACRAAGYPTQDGQRAAEVSLSDVRVGPDGVIGDPEGALPLVERVVDEAMAALAAEAVGCMAEMHALTVEYLKTRKQFGTTIGSFQVLQHKAVDMFVALEQARSMAMFGTMMADSDDETERRRAAAATKVQIGRSGRIVGQNAIQLHGGVGMTMEFKVGHYFKRATMIDQTFGDADHHLERLGALGGLMAA